MSGIFWWVVLSCAFVIEHIKKLLETAHDHG